MGLGNGSQVFSPPVPVTPFSNGAWNIRNRFSFDQVENAGGGGISVRSSGGLWASNTNGGTITGQSPTDVLPSVGFFTTAAGAGSQAFTQGGGVIRLALLNWVNWKVRLFDGANVRHWLAMHAGIITDLKNDDPGNVNNSNGFGFRYSTAAGDSTIKAVAYQHNALAAVTDTGIVPDTANFHLFEIRYNGANLGFYYDGVRVAGLVQNLPIGTPPPGTNYSLFPTMSVDNVGLANAKAIWYSQSFLSENF